MIFSFSLTYRKQLKLRCAGKSEPDQIGFFRADIAGGKRKIFARFIFKTALLARDVNQCDRHVRFAFALRLRSFEAFLPLKIEKEFRDEFPVVGKLHFSRYANAVIRLSSG